MNTKLLSYEINIFEESKPIGYASLRPSTEDMTLLYLSNIEFYFGKEVKKDTEIIKEVIKFSKMLGFSTLQTYYNSLAFYEAGFYWVKVEYDAFGFLEVKL